MHVTATFTDIYVAVSQFYGRQVQLLDSSRFEEYAQTFTADGEFQHTPGIPPARTHAGIVEELRRFNTRFDNDPVQRRHIFSMLNLSAWKDGAIDATFYALVLTTRPGVKQPVVGPSCLVRDVLVIEDGEVKNRSRQVEHDHMFSLV
ncbi:nuclear transport factor 2 family protein [Streptantibioticus ferralitis]|uniref:Nuclear transport factor 2 family protein n=1 Tax=Streptantibioticus ferralitis TaxID=236510 RepID=A0ABT5YY56_9ACTN|nr:nuclear transport factor 2 family protein [Streptantibioticus ferralitis]MDF2256527.1 nuclear transport factor 2 family protein [Streptantibioticus ferralitis]